MTRAIVGQLSGVNPEHGWMVILVLAGLLAIVIGVMQLVKMLRERPAPQRIEQPVAVKRAEEFVSRENCITIERAVTERLTKLEREMECIRAEMRVDRDSMQVLVRAEVGKVHDRINVMDRSIGEVQGTMQQIASALVILTGQVQRLAEKKD